MRTHGALGHFRQQGQLPRRRQQGIGVIGNQALPGFGGVHRVVVDQLAGIGGGTVDAVCGAFRAAAAAEAGGGEVLVSGQAKLRRIGKGLIEQHWNIEGNDLGVDGLQLPYQFAVELGAELGGKGLQRATVDGRRQANVWQQPDHDVLGACTLQGLHAVDQSISGGTGLCWIEYPALKEIVTATGEVVERVRVGAKAVGR
ncbi:hypothetical protein D3C80_1058740 [compost metagenome]